MNIIFAIFIHLFFSYNKNNNIKNLSLIVLLVRYEI